MSIDWVADVLDFHRKFCPKQIGDRPTVNQEWLELRWSLIIEELKELSDAMRSGDVPETADAMADLIYVIIGFAITCGIDLRPVWDAVQRANMSKVGGSTRADGKVLKPIGWQPPDIAGVLAAQRPLTPEAS